MSRRTRKTRKWIAIDSLSIPIRHPSLATALVEARQTGATHSVQAGSCRIVFRRSKSNPDGLASAAIHGDDERGWTIDPWIVWHHDLPDDADPISQEDPHA